ncbi:DUF3310 domain-containing protein [Staphylococcus shinii]|uniref:DUF3310 domain-containing protein n=1 Tax=Staphylococcus shinii TaxID=2912228 RepID=UPI00298F03C6|nr:DUF3310 domain-containing protein [Staphylococcus shinii]MDW8564684.1 DUF3310 domain-containing protein [Staphylococcus shinii]
MKIRELDLNQQIAVRDFGKNEYHIGRSVIGRVDEIILSDTGDEATVVSMGDKYIITDDNEFVALNFIESREDEVSVTVKQIDDMIQENKEYVENARNTPSHYSGDIDFIEYFAGQSTPEELRGAMKFTIGKYATRLGRKDEEIKELDKIIDFATRYKEILEGM